MQKSQDVSAKKVVIVSFVVDILDVLFNIAVAYFSGSVVMISESLQGVSDVVSSTLLLVGLEKSLKKEDHTHPFGYGREIFFWTLLAGLVMFGITSTFSVYFGIERFLHPQQISRLPLVFGILILTIFTNGYAFFISYKRLLKRRSLKHIIQIFYRSSLVETKTTFILDLMGTVSAVIGVLSLIVYVLTGNEQFDGVGAIIMGIVLAILSYFLLMGIKDLFVGRSASREVEERIKDAALEIPEVREVLGLKTLHIGSEKFLANIDVHLQAALKTREIERLIDQIKESIRENVPDVKHIQVELETPERR